MEKGNLKNRCKIFAHECVKLALELPNTDLGKHLRKQLIRCSTSVAANYRAASLGQTKPVFIVKLSIVIEESDESEFWLEFILDEKLLPESKLNKLLLEAHELTSIFITSRKTAEKNLCRRSKVEG